MKKLFTLFAVLALVGTTFVACEKDDESASNTITITGTINVGQKELIDPSFNLGDPENHVGFLTTFIDKAEANAMIIEPADFISLGDNLYLNYEMEIRSAEVGQTTMYCNVSIYEGIPDQKSYGFYVSSGEVAVNITKVGAVGEYIEGTYEGEFSVPTKMVIPTYQIKGKFKVKRIAPEFIK